MKNFAKKLLVIALAVGMCFVLCSCDFLGEMRETHACYADETKQTIIYNDSTYHLFSDDRIYGYALNGNSWGNVAAKDVPLLLTGIFGDEIEYSTSKAILWSEGNYYCREDYKDELEAFLDDPKMEHYCFDAFNPETSELETKVLSEDAVKLINDIISTGKPYEYNYDYSEINYTVMLYECDKDGTFTNGYIDVWEMTDGRYVIYTSVYREGYDEYASFCIDVPKENSLLFKEIFELSGYSEEVELW